MVALTTIHFRSINVVQKSNQHLFQKTTSFDNHEAEVVLEKVVVLFGKALAKLNQR